MQRRGIVSGWKSRESDEILKVTTESFFNKITNWAELILATESLRHSSSNKVSSQYLGMSPAGELHLTLYPVGLRKIESLWVRTFVPKSVVLLVRSIEVFKSSEGSSRDIE